MTMLNGARRWARKVALVRFGLRVSVATLVGIFAITAWSAPAAATWAVVSVDPANNDLGVAFASCLEVEVLGEPEEPLIPMVFVPGEGVAIYTDTDDTSVEAEIVGLLSQGVSPDQLLNNIDLSENPRRARGQYSVVSVDGASAARSGSLSQGDTANGASFAVHGNEVASTAIPTMQRALEGTADSNSNTGGPLADKLVAALLAGSEEGGDLRCAEQTALFAQLVVVGQEDTVEEPGLILTVVVDEGDGANPVAILAEEYKSGSSGLLDMGTSSGRGVWVYLAAAVLALIMVSSGFVVFKYGMGNTAARR